MEEGSGVEVEPYEEIVTSGYNFVVMKCGTFPSATINNTPNLQSFTPTFEEFCWIKKNSRPTENKNCKLMDRAVYGW